MSPMAELWAFLRRIETLQFDAESSTQSGWNGVGTGTVDVDSPTETVLIFTESGSWTAEGDKQLRFTNVYRWSLLASDLIRLEHLRFGVERPVFLFDLALTSDHTWASVSPHVCDKDCYTAELRLREEGAFLQWVVAGPTKQERIRYQYNCQQPANGSHRACL